MEMVCVCVCVCVCVYVLDTHPTQHDTSHITHYAVYVYCTIDCHPLFLLLLLLLDERSDRMLSPTIELRV